MQTGSETNLPDKIRSIEHEITKLESQLDPNVSHVSEEIDFLMLEESNNSDTRKRLRFLKQKLASLRSRPKEANRLSESEIFEVQKKMLYDCHNIAINSGAELDRQTMKLKDSQQKVITIDSKLATSKGLISIFQRNLYKNKITLLVVVCVVVLMILIGIFIKVKRNSN